MISFGDTFSGLYTYRSPKVSNFGHILKNDKNCIFFPKVAAFWKADILLKTFSGVVSKMRRRDFTKYKQRTRIALKYPTLRFYKNPNIFRKFPCQDYFLVLIFFHLKQAAEYPSFFSIFSSDTMIYFLLFNKNQRQLN